MDKLIEAEAKCAHKRVVYRPMPIEGGLWADRWYCDLCKSEFTPLAAVRAHDAETDEEVIAYRARQIWHRFVGIPITEPYTAEFQWLLDLLSGNEAPKKTLTEAVQAARGNLEPPTVPIRFDSPASHAPKPEPSQSAVIGTLRSEDFQRANACIECGTLVVHQELHVKWHAALVDRRTK